MVVPRLTSRRNQAIVLVAGGSLLALIAAGITLLPRPATGDHQPSGAVGVSGLDADPNPGADIFTQPRLSPPGDLWTGLTQGVVLEWLYPIDGSEVVIAELASGWCAETICPAPESWLRGVSFDSGEILWTADLAQFGLPNPKSFYLSDPETGQLAVLVHEQVSRLPISDSTGLPAEMPIVIAILDGETGQVLRTGQVFYQPPDETGPDFDGPFPIAFASGTLVLGPMPGPENTYTSQAFSISNLNQPKWTAPSVHPLAELSREIPKAVGEWITTPYGYVALEDGSPAPWGRELVLADESGFLDHLPLVYYGAAPDGAVFQVVAESLNDCTCQLWDITSDQALWPKAVACAGAWSLVRGNGQYYANHRGSDPDSVEPQDTLSVVSADDGHLLWSSPSGWAELVVDDRVLVSQYTDIWGIDARGPGLVLDAASGQFIKRLPWPESTSHVLGTRLIYTLAELGNTVEAWDVLGDSMDPLWELDIGEQRQFCAACQSLAVISRDEATYWQVQKS